VELIDEYYYFDPDLVGPVAPIMVEVGTFTATRALWWKGRYPDGRAILIEPDAENYEALCSQVLQAPHGIQTGRYALSLEGGPVILHRYPNRHSHSLFARHKTEGLELKESIKLESLTVPGILTRWSLDRIDLLLLNGEGCELYAAYHLSRPTAEGERLRESIPQVCTAAHPQIYGARVLEDMRTAWTRYYTEDRRPGPIPYFLYRRREIE